MNWLLQTKVAVTITLDEDEVRALANCVDMARSDLQQRGTGLDKVLTELEINFEDLIKAINTSSR